MDLADLSKLSTADAIDLVSQLHRANEQLHGSAVTLSRLSVALQESLGPAPAGATGALHAIGQFLAVQHSYEDLAALVRQQSVDIFGMDGGVLFLLDESGLLVPSALPDTIVPDPAILDHAAAIAYQALDAEAITSAPGDVAGTPACIALPLSRMGQDVGVVVMYRMAAEEPALSAEMWANLTIYAGTLGAICAGMRQAEALRRDARLLETLLAERARQVQNSRDLLRTVFDHLPEGILLIDGDGVILAANRFFSERIAGMHPRDLVGLPYVEVQRLLNERGMQRLTDMDGATTLVRLNDASGRSHSYAIGRSTTRTDDATMLEFWRSYDERAGREHA